jgi:trigger factor
MTEIIYETTSQDIASRSLQVTVPVERLEAAERRAVRQYAKQARLPGFRKGHAPEPVVRRRFGPEIRQYVLEESVRESWQQILADTELKPTADPQIRDVKFEDGAPLTFSLLVEVRPSLELQTTGGFQLERKAPVVTDAQVTEQIDALRAKRGTWAPLEGVVPQPGQLVSVTVETLVDGAPSGTASPHSLVLGEGQTIPDIEDRIMSMRPGETLEAAVRFPDDHPEASRRGETSTVRITLHEVKQQLLPDLDDAFAAELGEFASVDALRTAVREDLEADAVKETEAALRQQVIDQVVKANEVPAPASLVRRLLSAYAEAYQIDASQGDAFVSSFGPVAEAQVRRELVLDAVATAQNLRASEGEIDARIATMAASRGVETGALYTQLEKAGRLVDLERQLTEEKTFAWLLSQSTVTEGAA